MLEMKDVWFDYDGVDVLKGVSLSVEVGEIVGLVAPSGYGKSTVARLLSGYLKAKSGSVLVDGEDCFKVSGFHPVQLVHQHPEKAVNPRMKVEKILKEGWDVSDDVLASFGIGKSWLDKWPNELSGGELQRVCLARVVGPKTKYVLADEMTTMLDVVSTCELLRVLKDLVCKKQIGMLFISHDLDLVERYCDRVVVLSELNGL